MDAHAAQLRHQMDETRAAMDATLTQLEQRVSQMPAALLEQHVLGPVRGVQETAARATTWLDQYPWLIIAAGALLGSQLRRAHSRPVRPVPPPPPRAAVTPPREPDGLRGPAAAARPSGGSTDARGAHAGDTAWVTPVRLGARGVRRHRAGATGDRRNPGR
jgi:hypothetical protein